MTYTPLKFGTNKQAPASRLFFYFEYISSRPTLIFSYNSIAKDFRGISGHQVLYHCNSVVNWCPEHRGCVPLLDTQAVLSAGADNLHLSRYLRFFSFTWTELTLCRHLHHLPKVSIWIRKGWQVLLLQSKAEDMYCNQADSAILKLSLVQASMRQIYFISKQTYVVITCFCRNMGYVAFTRILSRIAFCHKYALFWFCFVQTFTQTFRIWLRFCADIWTKNWRLRPLVFRQTAPALAPGGWEWVARFCATFD